VGNGVGGIVFSFLSVSCGVGVSLVWVVLHYSELLQTTGQHNIYTNKTSERSKCVMESLEAQRCKGKHNHSH